jgi:hypothetical protein
MSKRFRYRESAIIAVESLELGIERRCLYQSASAIGMDRTIVAFACLLSSVCLRASDEKQLPSFDYYVARAHEIKRLNRIVEPFRFKVCARVSIHFTSRLPCPP